jgi:hypothetical protein
MFLCCWILAARAWLGPILTQSGFPMHDITAAAKVTKRFIDGQAQPSKSVAAPCKGAAA